MEFGTPKFKAPEKEQSKSGQYYKEALAIAQRISLQWDKLEGQELSDPKLQEIYKMNRSPVTGMQIWFHNQIRTIEESASDENAKSSMLYLLKEELERLEKIKNFKTPEKEQTNSEQYQKEALAIAQRISLQWQKLVEKLKLDKHALASSPKLQEIYEMNRPPQTGVRLWFENQIKFIEKSTNEESAKSHMMHSLKEDLERIEEKVNDIVE